MLLLEAFRANNYLPTGHSVFISRPDVVKGTRILLDVVVVDIWHLGVDDMSLRMASLKSSLLK